MGYVVVDRLRSTILLCRSETSYAPSTSNNNSSTTSNCPPPLPQTQTLNFQVTPPHLTSQLPTVPPDRLNSAGC